MEEKNAVHFGWIDVMKGISIILVILCHSGVYYTYGKEIGSPFWIEMAVPIFILINGYTSILSSQKRSPYSLKNMLRKVNRLIWTYGGGYAVYILLILFKGNTMTISEIVLNFFTGKKTVGGYYFCIMLQLIVLFPIFHYIYKKSKKKFLFGTILISVLFEVIIYYLQSDAVYEFYVLCSIRYWFIFAVGMCFKEILNKNIKSNYWLWICGIAYLIVSKYLDYPIFYIAYWRHSAYPIVLYIVPILKFASSRMGEGTKIETKIAYVGKASWHIMVTQMIWFVVVWNRFTSPFIETMVSLVICICVGLMYYQGETYIRRMLHILVERQKAKLLS